MMKNQGFTLLELMIVMVIVGILMTALLMSGAGIFGKSAEKETTIRIQTVAALLEQFRTIEGAYPDDRLPRGVSGNPMNIQAEALFIAFFSPGYSGETPNQDWLVNTDLDSSATSLTIFRSAKYSRLAMLGEIQLHISKACITKLRVNGWRDWMRSMKLNNSMPAEIPTLAVGKSQVVFN